MLEEVPSVQRNETHKSWADQSHDLIFLKMDVRTRIGWNIRRLRADRALTQEDFATDSGFDRGYISGVERGVRNPSILVLHRIANALNVDVAELLNSDKALEYEKLSRQS